jgi:hypothetical protein
MTLATVASQELEPIERWEWEGGATAPDAGAAGVTPASRWGALPIPPGPSGGEAGRKQRGGAWA